VTDLDAIRDDLGAFSHAIGCPLETFQAEALRLEKRVTTIVASRQAGKSRSLSVLGLWWGFRTPGQRVLIVSAGEDGAKRLLAETRDIALASPLLKGSVTDELASLLRLSNGSTIRSVPASEKQVRGLRTDLLLADEAALIADDLLSRAAMPTLSRARAAGRCWCPARRWRAASSTTMHSSARPAASTSRPSSGSRRRWAAARTCGGSPRRTWRWRGRR
jgi:hypothetical protein